MQMLTLSAEVLLVMTVIRRRSYVGFYRDYEGLFMFILPNISLALTNKILPHADKLVVTELEASMGLFPGIQSSR